MRRLVLSLGWLASAVLAGCWSEEPRVDGFTAEQWASLQKQFAPPVPPTTCPGVPEGTCDLAAQLGQELFFEPALSANGQVACTTCHDPKSWFVDTRTANSVSFGVTKWTAHNTISVVNIAIKPTVTWTGACQDRTCMVPENVITDIALPKAMGSSAALVAGFVRGNATIASQYTSVFGAPDDDATVMTNVATALTAYMRRLVSLDAPFDHYIVGNASALSDSARRGFTLFVGKAMCVECHSGSVFSDGKVHVTGVMQAGDHAPLTDTGAQMTGGFFTPPLRQVAQTGPYMHDGSLATLADVIEFYRRGGDAAGYTGTKDPLMQPVDISDDEAQDLLAYLRSLTGAPVPTDLTKDIR